MRMELAASRSRTAAARVASPRYLPQAESLMFEVIAVVAVSVATVQEGEEHMGGGGLVVAALELPQAHVVDDQTARAGTTASSAVGRSRRRARRRGHRAGRRSGRSGPSTLARRP